MAHDRYNLISPSRYQELKNRPMNWVIDSSDLAEDIFEADKIRAVLEWAARQACSWCAVGSERHWALHRSFQYEHQITPEFVAEKGLNSYTWIKGYTETFACLASDFVDGPRAATGCWYRTEELCKELYGPNSF